MLKISKKIQFSSSENKMNSIADTKKARDLYYSTKYQNVKFLLEKRFSWMNRFINKNDKGIEVGSGAGFAKDFISNENFKLTDLGEDDHLDLKNIDAQNTGFENESFDYVIASNMIHHIPYPIKFFREMNKILKKNGKLIIFDAHCSLLLQIVLILMRHEGFDFTKNVWDLEKASTKDDDLWQGNSAIPYLIFHNKKLFENNLGDKFEIKYMKTCECLLFLNSGGVTSKTFYVPLNFFFLKIIKYIDKFLTKYFPKFFALGYKIVLEKKD